MAATKTYTCDTTTLAKILLLAKRPISEHDIKKKCHLSNFYINIYIRKLLKAKLLKYHSSSKLLVITPKGHEFLRRVNVCAKILSEDINDLLKAVVVTEGRKVEQGKRD